MKERPTLGIAAFSGNKADGAELRVVQASWRIRPSPDIGRFRRRYSTFLKADFGQCPSSGQISSDRSVAGGGVGVSAVSRV